MLKLPAAGKYCSLRFTIGVSASRMPGHCLKDYSYPSNEKVFVRWNEYVRTAAILSIQAQTEFLKM